MQLCRPSWPQKGFGDGNTEPHRGRYRPGPPAGATVGEGEGWSGVGKENPSTPCPMANPTPGTRPKHSASIKWLPVIRTAPSCPEDEPLQALQDFSQPLALTSRWTRWPDGRAAAKTRLMPPPGTNPCCIGVLCPLHSRGRIYLPPMPFNSCSGTRGPMVAQRRPGAWQKGKVSAEPHGLRQPPWEGLPRGAAAPHTNSTVLPPLQQASPPLQLESAPACRRGTVGWETSALLPIIREGVRGLGEEPSREPPPRLRTCSPST